MSPTADDCILLCIHDWSYCLLVSSVSCAASQEDGVHTISMGALDHWGKEVFNARASW